MPPVTMHKKEDDHAYEHRPISDAIERGVEKSPEFGPTRGKRGDRAIQRIGKHKQSQNNRSPK